MYAMYEQSVTLEQSIYLTYLIFNRDRSQTKCNIENKFQMHLLNNVVSYLNAFTHQPRLMTLYDARAQTENISIFSFKFIAFIDVTNLYYTFNISDNYDIRLCEMYEIWEVYFVLFKNISCVRVDTGLLMYIFFSTTRADLIHFLRERNKQFLPALDIKVQIVSKHWKHLVEKVIYIFFTNGKPQKSIMLVPPAW